MKTVVDMIEEVSASLEEMNEKLKELSAKELMVQRELDNIKTEKDYIQENIPLYRGILEDLTKRRDGENNRVMKGEKKPVNELNALQMSMTRAAKKIIAVDEKGDIIAEYKSQHAAALDLGVQYPTISWRVRKMNKVTQLKKFGYALIVG